MTRPAITNFYDASEALRPFYDNARTVYTLDNMRTIMAYLGNPQDKIKVLHVAGTSGKTSTAYYTAALLTAAGYKTGLTVSPHVDTLNERVQINVTPVPEADFCRALTEFLQLIDECPVKPSWFEAMAGFAFWYFALQEVDYAVVEVGLGGLHDGTNVITRPDKVCLITDIGIDHTAILGKNLAEIAWQKAGIMQSGNVAFTYRQSPEIMDQFAKRAVDIHADLRALTPSVIDLPGVGKLPAFQQRNLGLARTAVDYVLDRDHSKALTPDQIENACKIVIPGRMEAVNYRGKTVILDGAHNGQKLSALFDSIRATYPVAKPLVLAAFVEGEAQRWQEAIQVLVQNNVELMLTDFYSEKDYKKYSVDPHVVAQYSQEHGLPAEVVLSPELAFEEAMAKDNDLLIVAGSFYLLNHIRPLTIKA